MTSSWRNAGIKMTKTTDNNDDDEDDDDDDDYDDDDNYATPQCRERINTQHLLASTSRQPCFWLHTYSNMSSTNGSHSTWASMCWKYITLLQFPIKLLKMGVCFQAQTHQFNQWWPKIICQCAGITTNAFHSVLLNIKLICQENTFRLCFVNE